MARRLYTQFSRRQMMAVLSFVTEVSKQSKTGIGPLAHLELSTVNSVLVWEEDGVPGTRIKIELVQEAPR